MRYAQGGGLTDAFVCDQGYDCDKYRRLLRERGIEPVIARRGAAHGSGLGKVRWVVARAFAASDVHFERSVWGDSRSRSQGSEVGFLPLGAELR